jgi:hypothetical protein
LIQGRLCNNAEWGEHSCKLPVTTRCKLQTWIFQLIARFSVGKRSYWALKCTQISCRTTTSSKENQLNLRQTLLHTSGWPPTRNWIRSRAS